MKYPILFILIFFALPKSLFGQNSSIDSTLREIETLYNAGQYVSSELEARRMLEDVELKDSTKVLIEKWIAFSLIAQGKSALAKERFTTLLKIDEMFELDPVLTSPKILSVFNDAKTKFLSQKRNMIVDSTKYINERNNLSVVTYRTIVFPGWEQLHHGRTTSGYTFLVGGAVTLTSGVVFEVLRANARDKYLHAKTEPQISSRYETYNKYRKAEIYSFAAFTLIYIVSEIDVFTNYGFIVHPSTSHIGGNQVSFSVRF